MSDDALADFRLPGRVAVVTGAASGIGRATARLLAGAGARVVLGDVDEAGLAETAAGIDGTLTQRTDVSRRDEVHALVRRAVEAFGGLDVMVNVAGVIHDAEVTETREADLDRVLAVNLKGTFFGCQAAVAAMRERGAGSIVNTASSGAWLAIPKLAAYSLSKAAVVALTRVLAAEVGPQSIRVNAVAPGFVESPMSGRHARRADGSLDPDGMQAVRERARRRNPLGRAGQPEDIARAVLFLASDAARYVTGQVLHANGGSPMV